MTHFVDCPLRRARGSDFDAFSPSVFGRGIDGTTFLRRVWQKSRPGVDLVPDSHLFLIKWSENGAKRTRSFEGGAYKHSLWNTRRHFSS